LGGLQNEIYRIPFPNDIFAGLTFSVIAQHIYKEFGLILFALEVNLGGHVKVFVNPSDYIFQDMTHYGYVFADSLPDIDILANFKIPD
jgi:potassium large conductance calcium-activated channel subfamily M alpha protein 1